MKYGKCCFPLAAFRVEADERIEKNRIQLESRLDQLAVNELSELKITRPDACFEENGGVEKAEARVEVVRGEVEVGNGFVELRDTEIARENETLKVGVFGV